MAEDLKPCPFCGGKPYPKRTEDTDWSGACFVSMKCVDCGAETHAVYGTGDPSEWADARAAWNRRAALAAQQAPAAVPADILRDAKRYRYLRGRIPAEVLGQVKSAAGCWIDGEDEEGVLILLTGDDADAAIDAAMAAAPTGGEG